ncbi:hypothetical protein FM101_08025 [Arthrobacter rhombi]|uniref:Uncharacterized protein n=1 Tax=Arthrobacter rhombi TaxID=71253 RepID=A0A1R4G6H9_9MICC|nr:hypothetical protein FM101_08025 [Arthrobacter rhombi]
MSAGASMVRDAVISFSDMVCSILLHENDRSTASLELGTDSTHYAQQHPRQPESDVPQVVCMKNCS